MFSKFFLFYVGSNTWLYAAVGVAAGAAAVVAAPVVLSAAGFTAGGVAAGGITGGIAALGAKLFVCLNKKSLI